MVEIDFTSGSSAPVNIEVMDITGSVIYKVTRHFDPNSILKEHVRLWHEGVFIIRVAQSHQCMFVERIVVIK